MTSFSKNLFLGAVFVALNGSTYCHVLDVRSYTFSDFFYCLRLLISTVQVRFQDTLRLVFNPN